MTATSTRYITAVGIVAALFCYVLPWLTVPDSPLTLNAYDLAEWISLHPASRSAQLPLLSSFLLRFPLVVLSILIATLKPQRFTIGWVLSLVAIIALAIAQLPPVDQLLNFSDSNYRQQLTMAIMTLIFSLPLLLIGERQLSDYFTSLFWFILAAVVVGAMLRASELFQMFELSPQIASGAVLFTIISIALAALSLFHAVRK